jgi:hypothetical protein
MTSHMPKRHHSLLHRHHSTRSSKTDLTPDPNVFDGTDSITAHKRVALSRVIEAHDALAAQSRNNAPRTEPSAPDDPSGSEFDSLLTSLPNGEVRIFKYLLRKWDHNQYPDPELEQAIAAFRPQFEEAAVKHFFRRITLWNESEEMMAAAKQGLQKDSKIIRRTSLGKMWWRERTRPDAEQSVRDELKQVTTREGLAQLLWTLLNDVSSPLTPELFEECKNAVKKMYGIHNVDMDRPKS